MESITGSSERLTFERIYLIRQPGCGKPRFKLSGGSNCGHHGAQSCLRRRQEVQNLVNGNPKAPNTGFSPAFTWFDGDSLPVVHGERYPPPVISVNHSTAVQCQPPATNRE